MRLVIVSLVFIDLSLKNLGQFIFLLKALVQEAGADGDHEAKDGVDGEAVVGTCVLGNESGHNAAEHRSGGVDCPGVGLQFLRAIIGVKFGLRHHEPIHDHVNECLTGRHGHQEHLNDTCALDGHSHEDHQGHTLDDAHQNYPVASPRPEERHGVSQNTEDELVQPGRPNQQTVEGRGGGLQLVVVLE